MAGAIFIVVGLVALGGGALVAALLVRPRAPGPAPVPQAAPPDATVHVSDEARQAATYAPPAPDPENARRAAEHGFSPELAQTLWDAVMAHPVPEEEREACFADRVTAFRALEALLANVPAGDTLAGAFGEAAEHLTEADFDAAWERLAGAARHIVEDDSGEAPVPADHRLAAAAAWAAAGDLKRVVRVPGEAAACYLEAAELVPDGHGSLRADYLNMWGIASFDAGNYASAEDAFTRAVQVRRKTQGAEHPDVAMAQTNLGEFFLRLGRHTAAEPLFRKALAIRERALGPDHPDLAGPLNHLANLYQERGQGTRAEPYLHRVLSIMERSHGPDAIELVPVLDRMGRLCLEHDRTDEAEAILRRALSVRQSRLGIDHPDVADTHEVLGRLYERMGREVDAELAYGNAVQVRETVLGRQHTKVGHALVRLAATYLAQERNVEARPLLQRALEILETPFGAPAAETGEALALLGEIHRRQGRHADAGPLFRRALKVLERTERPGSELLASALDRYAQLYADMHRESDAERLTARAESVRAGNVPRRPARV